MKIIEVLHSFWTGNRTENPRNRKNWVQLEKEIKETVPQDKQEILTRMIEDHSNSVEIVDLLQGLRLLQSYGGNYDRFGHLDIVMINI